MTNMEELRSAHDYARKCFRVACKSPVTTRAQYDVIRDNYITALRAEHDALEADLRECDSAYRPHPSR